MEGLKRERNVVMVVGRLVWKVDQGGVLYGECTSRTMPALVGSRVLENLDQ